MKAYVWRLGRRRVTVHARLSSRDAGSLAVESYEWVKRGSDHVAILDHEPGDDKGYRVSFGVEEEAS